MARWVSCEVGKWTQMTFEIKDEYINTRLHTRLQITPDSNGLQSFRPIAKSAERPSMKLVRATASHNQSQCSLLRRLTNEEKKSTDLNKGN